MKISLSILAAKLTDMKRLLEQVDPLAIDFVHLDVMDGHFVPQISFGESYAAEVAGRSAVPLDLHLMVSCPEREVPKYFALQPHNITFHLEATRFPVRLIENIHSKGIRAGIALNPSTSVAMLEPILGLCDLILLMSVEPGFYGQSFLENVLPKIEQLRSLPGGKKVLLEADGGIGRDNIDRLAIRGVDIAVVGSACFPSGDQLANFNDNALQLKEACKRKEAYKSFAPQ